MHGGEADRLAAAYSGPMADEGMIDRLDRIIYGAVAITNLALTESAVEVTLPQWRVLVIVGQGPDGATVSEIAARLGAAVSPASKLVTRLERRGLLVTGKDPADRRVTRVRLSEGGRVLRTKVIECRREYVRRIIESVGPAPAGANAFLGQLAEEFAAFG
jgi:DNA-binding MarR family transcriptional regulator